jgi:hypothetical protein
MRDPSPEVRVLRLASPQCTNRREGEVRTDGDDRREHMKE